jgi:hypothetical protein
MPAATTDLKNAVFHSVYFSREQRRFRLAAIVLLSLRHAVRGIIFSWPLYFIALVPFLMPIDAGWWIVLFVFPALLVSMVILVKGVKDDYAGSVSGQILKGQELIKILWWGI